MISQLKMKKYVDVEKIAVVIQQDKLTSWIDKITFSNIFVVWLTIVVSFGIIYSLLSSSGSYLQYSIGQQKVTQVLDAIYFSFVTATTTGFGDIIPHGAFKVVSILEAVFGFMLLAVVTSKLISLKQDVILGELYELSFHERINRLRSTMLVYRQTLDRLMSLLEAGAIRKREIANLYVSVSSLEDALSEVEGLLKRPVNNQIVKTLDHVHSELIFTSMLQSLEKTYELLHSFDENQKAWRSENNSTIIQRVAEHTEEIYKHMLTDKWQPMMHDALTSRKQKILVKLKDVLSDKEKRQQELHHWSKE